MALWIWLLACGPREAWDVDVSDEHNYAFSSSIEAEAQVVAAETDFLLDWGGLASDLLGEPIDPTTDIGRIGIARFANSTQDEILEAIANDTLLQASLTRYAYLDVDAEAPVTSAMLSELCIVGTCVDPAEELFQGGGVYLITAATGTTQFRMLHFVDPIDDAPVVDVTIDETCATLLYDVDLESAERIRFKQAEQMMVDWRGLTTDGVGNPLDLSDIDLLMLARYDESLEELAADFLRLEELPEQVWEADVEGKGSYDLRTLMDADGAAFEGFREDGTWILALRCSTCVNPAPLFLGIID